jgi:hypothetical protein
MHQAKLAFNAGEVTPYLRHRIDIDKADSAAELMENFLAMPYGGVMKRPGLHWLKSLGGAQRNSRLLPFIASDGSRYLLHFTPDTLTIYDTAGTVKDSQDFMDGYGWPGAFDWENSIRDLHMVQLNDVAFFTHPGTFPLRLSRLSDTEWRLRFIPFERAPTLDENRNKTKTFTVASDPVADTWADGESYAIDDKVFIDCEWQCIGAHTASSSNKPGSGAAWRENWRRMFYREGDAITLICDERSETAWARKGLDYAVDDIVATIPTFFFGNDPWVDGEDYVYVCVEAYNTDDDSTLPSGATSKWKDCISWLQTVPPANTSGSFLFQVGFNFDHCNHNGEVYRCLVAHAPHASPAVTEPGVGSSWATYWELVGSFAPNTFVLGGTYEVGERVSTAGRVFICILEHIPVSANKPGAGASWATYWSEESRMVESFAENAFSPGNYYRISPERDDQDFQVELAATSANDGLKSPVIIVQGAWNFFTYGTWDGIFTLQRSANGGKSWTTVRAWEGSADRNVADSGTEDEPVWLRLKWSHGATGSSNPRGVLVPESPSVTGYALMTAYVGPEEMTGVAKTSLMSGNTYRWAEGAFNSRYGFPRALALHESRLCFAGTTSLPVSLWISASDDLLNFEPGVEDDDGIFVTLALSASSPIRWLASQRRLFIGTAFGEWVTGSETTDQPLSPSNFLARQYSGYGSAPIAPHLGGDAILFLDRKATRLRELAFDDSRGSYDAADLTRLGEHLTRGGISNMSWQATREPGLWTVRRDGVLLHFAFNRQEKVAAWSRHSTTGGEWYDVAILPSDGGDDEIFFIIQRGANMHLERFPQNWQAAVEDNAGWFHLDGVSGSGTTIAIPAHLRSPGITRLLAPTTAPVVTVQDYTGDATQTIPAAVWQIGKTIPSALDSLPVDMQGQDGTTQARRKRLRKVLLSLYQSRGGQVWNRSGSNKQTIPAISTDILRTGWAETVPDAGALDDVQLRIFHDEPFPFCLRCAVLRWEVHEG